MIGSWAPVVLAVRFQWPWWDPSAVKRMRSRLISPETLMAAANVLAKEIAAEVAVRIAPDGVDVVDGVLSVVVLDEERSALEPVVMRTPRPVFSRPCEVDVVDPRPLDPIPFDGRERFGQPLDIDAKELGEQLPL